MLARTLLCIPGTTLKCPERFKSSPTPSLGHRTALEIAGKDVGRHSILQQQLQIPPTMAQQNTQLCTLLKTHLEKHLGQDEP